MRRFEELLSEMYKLPKLVTNKFGNYIDMNAAARQRRAGNITYQDDKRYKDHEGALWLNVKHKDFYTIAAAVLTGMYDTDRLKQYDDDETDIDEIVSSKENIDAYLENNKRAKTLVNNTWNFLKQHMSKGTVTVYRGLEITKELIPLLQADPYVLYNPKRIIQYVDNTTKEFNSFSVSKSIAIGFATRCQDYIVFSAEIDNNDINWAFTAYLDGRHGGIGEYELNVNNIKRLRNIQLVDYSANAFRNIVQLQKVRNNLIKVNNFEDVDSLVVYPLVKYGTRTNILFKFTLEDDFGTQYYPCDEHGTVLSNEGFEDIQIFANDKPNILIVAKSRYDLNLLDITTHKLLLPKRNYSAIVPMSKSATRILTKYYVDGNINANIFDLALHRYLFDETLKEISTEGFSNNAVIYRAQLRDIDHGEEDTIFLNGKTCNRIFDNTFSTKSTYLGANYFDLVKDKIHHLGFANGKILPTSFSNIENVPSTNLIKIVLDGEVNFLNKLTNKLVLKHFVDEVSVSEVTSSYIELFNNDLLTTTTRIKY